MQTDVVVLGAGIIGVSAALHLQARGRSVVLLDRRGAGEETSHGNAGLIERASIVPYGFPRDLASLIRYGLNRSPEAHYHLAFLPKVAPWLAQYWWHSSPGRHAVAAKAMLPLIERCVAEHEALMREADILPMLRRIGWIKGFRDKAEFQLAEEEARASAAAYGLKLEVLSGAALSAKEPHLTGEFAGGLHWLDPASVPDPGGVTRAYAELFEKRGGRFLRGDARSLAASGSSWTVTAEEGPVTAREVVVALGPWSGEIFRPLGYRIPLAVKRGYHMHYRPSGNAVLNHPLYDVSGGFLIVPMTRGIRLTTGAEFADRDAAPSPVQLARVEPAARRIFPLGERVDAAPWIGARPCLPDMRPVIGEAPRHKGLWFAFGHNHHGFTLGPVTGHLLAQMMSGEEPLTDPAPYAVGRFGR